MLLWRSVLVQLHCRDSGVEFRRRCRISAPEASNLVFHPDIPLKKAIAEIIGRIHDFGCFYGSLGTAIGGYSSLLESLAILSYRALSGTAYLRRLFLHQWDFCRCEQRAQLPRDQCFLLTCAPFTVARTALIVTSNRDRHASHTSADFRPDAPVVFKRASSHTVSFVLSLYCELITYECFSASFVFYVSALSMKAGFPAILLTFRVDLEILSTG